MHSAIKLTKELQKILATNQKNICNEINATYAVPNRDNYIEKCNSDAFLLKIDQGNAKHFENKPKNITTDYCELTLYMLPGSKSGLF